MSAEHVVNSFVTPALKQLIPIAVVLLMGYCNYTFGYVLCYSEIYIHDSKGVAITLWVLFGIVQLIIYGLWAQIMLSGPGKSPKIKPYNLAQNEDPDNSFSSLPDAFLSDSSGYPFWCTACQSIKLPGVHHSSDAKSCVLRMDHYCFWISSVVGQKNYRYFVKFVLWYWSLFWLMLIPLIRYTGENYHRRTTGLNGNFIVLYVACVFWLIMLTALFCSHILYIVRNLTTLDDISKKNNRRRLGGDKEPVYQYVNLKYHDSRYVVQLDLDENPFDHGMKENWIRLWLPYLSHLQVDDIELQKTDSNIITSNRNLALSFIFFFIPFIDAKMASPENYTERPDEKISKENKNYDTTGLGQQFSSSFINHCNEKISSGMCSWPPKYQSSEQDVQLEIIEDR